MNTKWSSIVSDFFVIIDAHKSHGHDCETYHH